MWLRPRLSVAGRKHFNSSLALRRPFLIQIWLRALLRKFSLLDQAVQEFHDTEDQTDKEQ